MPEHADDLKTPPRRRSRWQVFTGWHRTEQLWRELYARTVSALAATLVIYLVAVVSGVVSRKPLPWLILLFTLGPAAIVVDELRRRRRGVPDWTWNNTAVFGVATALLVVATVIAFRVD